VVGVVVMRILHPCAECGTPTAGDYCPGCREEIARDVADLEADRVHRYDSRGETEEDGRVERARERAWRRGRSTEP